MNSLGPMANQPVVMNSTAQPAANASNTMVHTRAAAPNNGFNIRAPVQNDSQNSRTPVPSSFVNPRNPVPTSSAKPKSPTSPSSVESITNVPVGSTTRDRNALAPNNSTTSTQKTFPPIGNDSVQFVCHGISIDIFYYRRFSSSFIASTNHSSSHTYTCKGIQNFY